MNTSCHIGNRIFFRVGTKKTAYEIWNGKKLRVKYFRVFGSKCYILNDRENLGKFDAKSDEGFFFFFLGILILTGHIEFSTRELRQ